MSDIFALHTIPSLVTLSVSLTYFVFFRGMKWCERLPFTESIILKGFFLWILLYVWLLTFRYWEETLKTRDVTSDVDRKQTKEHIRQRYQRYLIFATFVGIAIGIFSTYEHSVRARKMFQVMVSELQLKGFTRQEALRIVIRRMSLNQLLAILRK